MPKPASSALLLYPSYRGLLELLMRNALSLAQHLVAEMQGPRAMSPDAIARNFLVLSTIVRRSVVIARYLDTLPVPVEEKEGRILAALDRVFRAFAADKMDIDTYHALLDQASDAEFDDEREMEGFDVEREQDADADVPGRRPCILVAELCRDFGLACHAVPSHWLDPVPADLRLLCARAAAAAIRPTSRPGRVGHMMER